MVFLWSELGKTDYCPTPAFKRQLSEFTCIAWWIYYFGRLQSSQRGPQEDQGWEVGKDAEETVVVVQDGVDVRFGPRGVYHEEGGFAEGERVEEHEYAIVPAAKETSTSTPCSRSKDKIAETETYNSFPCVKNVEEETEAELLCIATRDSTR